MVSVCRPETLRSRRKGLLRGRVRASSATAAAAASPRLGLCSRLPRARPAPQADARKAYLADVRAALDAGLCLRSFPSMTVERQTRVEVEERTSKELLLPPVLLTRGGGGGGGAGEAVLVEPAVNSCRVSVRLRAGDDAERLLGGQLSRFLAQRADALPVLRRKPVEGYDVTFLITHAHTTRLVKARLVDFLVAFVDDAARELSAMKLSLNARARTIARELVGSLVPPA